MPLKLMKNIIIFSIIANIIVFLFGFSLSNDFMMILATANIALLSTFFMNPGNFSKDE